MSSAAEFGDAQHLDEKVKLDDGAESTGASDVNASVHKATAPGDKPFTAHNEDIARQTGEDGHIATDQYGEWEEALVALDR